ncbi:hypothetical protein BH24ACI2_BH24ACI2_04830 [soil metagenome]|jgi:hypothetical protein
MELFFVIGDKLIKSTMFILFLLSVVPIFVFAQKSEYIGYRYKPVLMDELLPNGIKDLGGGIIIENNKITSYAIGRFSKGKTQMLWLELATGENETGVTGWEVKDVLIFPNFTKNQELLFTAETCTINGKRDEKLVVFADFLQTKKKYIVRKAWRTNLKTEKFETVSIKGVRCEYYEP